MVGYGRNVVAHVCHVLGVTMYHSPTHIIANNCPTCVCVWQAAKKAAAQVPPPRLALEEAPPSNTNGGGQQRTASAEALDELRRQAPESVALTKDVVAFLQS